MAEDRKKALEARETVESVEETAEAVSRDAGAAAAVAFVGEEVDWLKTDLANVKGALKRLNRIAETTEARTVAIATDVARVRAFNRELGAELQRMREATVTALEELRAARLALEEARRDAAQGDEDGQH